MTGQPAARPAWGAAGGLGLALLAVLVYRLGIPAWVRWFVGAALLLAAVLLLLGTARRRGGSGR